MKKMNIHLKFAKQVKISLPHYPVSKMGEAKVDGYKTGV
jgi:hypothetical protein